MSSLIEKRLVAEKQELRTQLAQLQARNRELTKLLERAAGLLDNTFSLQWAPWADLSRAIDAALAHPRQAKEPK